MLRTTAFSLALACTWGIELSSLLSASDCEQDRQIVREYLADLRAAGWTVDGWFA